MHKMPNRNSMNTIPREKDKYISMRATYCVLERATTEESYSVNNYGYSALIVHTCCSQTSNVIFNWVKKVRQITNVNNYPENE
jgi:hypothetical protein